MCIVSLRFFLLFLPLPFLSIFYAALLFGSFSKHIGRRKFLLSSGLGMTLCTLIAAFFMYFKHTAAAAAIGGDTILLICVLGYVCCSSLGVLVIVSVLTWCGYCHFFCQFNFIFFLALDIDWWTFANWSEYLMSKNCPLTHYETKNIFYFFYPPIFRLKEKLAVLSFQLRI